MLLLGITVLATLRLNPLAHSDTLATPASTRLQHDLQPPKKTTLSRSESESLWLGASYPAALRPSSKTQSTCSRVDDSFEGKALGRGTAVSRSQCPNGGRQSIQDAVFLCDATSAGIIGQHGHGAQVRPTTIGHHARRMIVYTHTR